MATTTKLQLLNKRNDMGDHWLDMCKICVFLDKSEIHDDYHCISVANDPIKIMYSDLFLLAFSCLFRL